MVPAAPVNAPAPGGVPGPREGGAVRRRGLWLFVLMAVGVAAMRMAGESFPDAAMLLTWIALAGSAACSAAGGFAPGRAAGVLLGLGALLFGAGVQGARTDLSPAHDLRHALGAEPAMMTAVGEVATAPRAERIQRGTMAPFARFNPEVSRFRLRVRGVVDREGRVRPATGTLMVRVDDADLGAGVGDRVRITGFAQALRAPTNPGEADLRETFLQRGVVGGLRAPNAELVEVLDRDGAGPAGRIVRGSDELVEWLRARAAGAVDRAVGDQAVGDGGDATDEAGSAGALLRALLLGERRGERIEQLSRAFTRVGVAHILAISGMHVGLALVGVWLLVRLSGDRPRLEAAAALLVLAAILIVVPARAPVIRAGAIGLALLAARWGGRRYDALNTLGLVAAGILLWRPSELWNPGFQLSFGVVAGLIACALPLRAALFGPAVERDQVHGGRAVMLEWLKTAFAASLCAWLIATPIVAHHFGIFSPLAVVGSLLALPFVAIAVVLGYVGLAAGVAWPWLGGTLLGAAGAAAEALAWVVGLLGGVRWSVVYLPWIGGITAGLCALAVAAWMIRWGRLRSAAWDAPVKREPWRAAARWGLTVAAVVLVGVDVSRSGSLGGDQALRVDALDVGNGSCYLIRSGDDAVLFDCGSDWLAIGERTIPLAVRRLGCHRVPTVIVSHPDIDHFAGLVDIAGPLGVERVLTCAAFFEKAGSRPDGAEAFVLGELERRGIEVSEVRAGDGFELGPAHATVLNPDPDVPISADNDASVAVLFEVETDAGVRTLLMTGDIERDAMEAVEGRLAERVRLEVGSLVTIMEAPHHGSARPFAFAFVDWVDPQLVIQSTGPQRLGDERWDEVKQGREWLVTAGEGAVSVWIGADGEVGSRVWGGEASR